MYLIRRPNKIVFELFLALRWLTTEKPQNTAKIIAQIKMYRTINQEFILWPGEGYLFCRSTSSALNMAPVSGCTVTLSPVFTFKTLWTHFCRPTFPPGKVATGHPKHTCSAVTGYKQGLKVTPLVEVREHVIKQERTS